MIYLRTFWCLTLLGSWVSSGLAGEVDPLRKRFFDEAPRKWQEMRDLSLQLQGEMNYTSHEVTNNHDKPTLIRQWRYRINQAHQCKLFVIRAVFSTNPKMVPPRGTVVNSKYAFTVSERNAEAGWILGELDLKQNGKKGTINLAELNDDVDKTACAHLRINQIPLPKMISANNFHLKKIHSHRHENGEDVVLSFAFDRDNSIAGPLAGSIVFDPGNYWVVKSADLKCDIGTINEHRRQIENTYAISPRGLPIAKLTTERTSAENIVFENKWQYDLREQVDVPEHEFSLSAFGLPEPRGSEIPRPAKQPYYLWLSLAGVALIALAIVAARLAKKWTKSRAVGT
jgi:hypothetical protein